MGARAIAWCVLLAACLTVVLVAYCIISSTLSFFRGEASKVVGQLGDAPQLRVAVESALRFCSSFVWTAFALLLLALTTSLLVLFIEDVASR